MKNLSSWLIAIFAFLFWGYRVVATVLYAMGTELVLTPMDMTMEITLNNTASLELYMNIFVALIGVIIPVAAFFDVLLDKNRKANPVHKQTDWFYKNKDYDRKLDERADKNQYRTL